MVFNCPCQSAFLYLLATSSVISSSFSWSDMSFGVIDGSTLVFLSVSHVLTCLLIPSIRVPTMLSTTRTISRLIHVLNILYLDGLCIS